MQAGNKTDLQPWMLASDGKGGFYLSPGGASRGEDEASQQAESPDRSLRTGTLAEHQQSQDRGYERLGQVQRGNCGSRQPSQAAGEQ